MKSHILANDFCEVLVQTGSSQTLNRIIKAVNIGIAEFAEHRAKGKHLDLPPQFDHQGLDFLTRSRTDSHAAVGLGTQQALLGQLEERVADRRSADAIRFGQGLLAETGPFGQASGDDVGADAIGDLLADRAEDGHLRHRWHALPI